MTELNAPAADATQRHLAHVARGGALGLFGAAVSAVAGFVLVLVVTNRFDTRTAGLFFTATSTFLVLNAMATLGSDTGLGRFMLRYEKHGRLGDIPPTLRAAMRPTIGFSLVLGLAVVAFADPLSRLIGLEGGEGPNSLRLMGALLPFATWNLLTLAGTRAFGRMRATVLVDKILRPVAQPVLALAVSVLGAGLLSLTLAWSVPYVLAALMSALLFRRFLHRRGTMTHTQPTKDYRALRREFWAFTWPRSITQIAQMAIQRLDIVLIAALRSPTEAAIYTAATRFVALGQFGTQALQQVLQPKFTTLLATDDHKSLREVFQVSTAWSMGITWPMFVVVGCAPFAYLGLFGPEYVHQGVATVLLMAVAMLFNVATGAADTLLLMSGRSGLSLFNSLTAVALDVGMCLWLIPSMGITGAALAWAVSSSTRCVLAVLQVRLTMDIVSFGPAAGIVAAANLVCIAAPLLVLGRYMHVDFLRAAIACVICAPAYLGVLWLGRRPLMLTALRAVARRPGTGAADPEPRNAGSAGAGPDGG
jgi:O-antigen/teichoic acid export membrane protein